MHATSVPVEGFKHSEHPRTQYIRLRFNEASSHQRQCSTGISGGELRIHTMVGGWRGRLESEPTQHDSTQPRRVQPWSRPESGNRRPRPAPPPRRRPGRSPRLGGLKLATGRRRAPLRTSRPPPARRDRRLPSLRPDVRLQRMGSRRRRPCPRTSRTGRGGAKVLARCRLRTPPPPLHGWRLAHRGSHCGADMMAAETRR